MSTAAALPRAFHDIEEDFALLDDWEDRYRYLIELGRTLEPLAPDEKTESTRVRGCASQVWLAMDDGGDGRFRFRGDSDAMIVRGLIAVLVALYSGGPAEAILADDPQAVFERLALGGHLTQQRANGLSSMVGRLREAARARTGAA